MTGGIPQKKEMTGAGDVRLLLTVGDPAGIGPEVVLKALLKLSAEDLGPVGVISPPLLLELAAAKFNLPLPAGPGFRVIPPDDIQSEDEDAMEEVLFCGRNRIVSARIALASLETGVRLVAEDPRRRAIVTGPVNKKGLHDAGMNTPGLTEWLAWKLDIPVPLMLLVGGGLRVATATTHIPIREVASALNVEGMAVRLAVLKQGLQQRFGISDPRIALLALNPHGGKGAEAGREESEILGPALQKALSRGINAEGLFSADTFFGRRLWKNYDAVLAPYHDQGLTAVKVEAGGMGVNVTLGLPVVRTSPDHGTAFDIAGKGVAEEGAMVAAVRLADRLLDGRGAG